MFGNKIEYIKHDYETLKKKILEYLAIKDSYHFLKMSSDKKELKNLPEYREYKTQMEKYKKELQFNNFPAKIHQLRSFVLERTNYKASEDELNKFALECLKYADYALIYFRGNDVVYISGIDCNGYDVAFDTILNKCTIKEIYNLLEEGKFNKNEYRRDIYRKFGPQIFEKAHDFISLYKYAIFFSGWVTDDILEKLLKKLPVKLNDPKYEHILSNIIRARLPFNATQKEFLESLVMVKKLQGGK